MGSSLLEFIEFCGTYTRIYKYIHGFLHGYMCRIIHGFLHGSISYITYISYSTVMLS